MRRAIIGLTAIGVLTGCSMGADIKQVEGEIPTFHKELDAGQFNTIYSNASPELKHATTQTDMIQLLSAVHRKLGAFVSGKGAGWNDNATTSGHFVTENYSAQYSRGSATESFVYKLDGQQPILAGYHINSNALIVN